MTDAARVLLVVAVLAGAVPLVVAAYQFLLVGLHRWRDHYDRCADHLPRTAVVVPAWNEAAVLGTTIDQLLALDYPPGHLRVVVVDDASTDDTPALLTAKAAEHPPGAVVHLRREQGGEGKAHTLNHGLRAVLADDWAEAVLIMDADVLYEPDALRRMTRHLADPEVGAVTAYIKEGSRPGTCLTRFIAYEYVTAQAAARRAQNVIGALACLAGGAQLHSRANLEAIGGQIDTSSLAEDTITTFETQLAGRKVVFEPHAVAWAEEPPDLVGLWKQRMRWARGNVQVTRRYKHLWFRPRAGGRLGSTSFGLIWFSLLLLPLLMIASSVALVGLYLMEAGWAYGAFRALWIVNALAFVFTTAYALLLDPPTARRSWRQAIFFPGAISVAIIAYSCFPALFHWVGDRLEDGTGFRLGAGAADGLVLFLYVWASANMAAAWLLKVLDQAGWHRLSRGLVYLVGYGPVLCAVTLGAYVQELRGTGQRWEKTEKVGRVGVRS